ncbi:MAG: bifunctional 4-hydroxy-2-oxoglutarate aldolase/2-dehydro-3-deoxy-phosphogluconate aldolase [Acutalibacteraceae bacterium]
MNDFFAAIHQIGLIPVIKIQDANQAVPLAKALLRGGLQAAEITFRTDAAAESIQAISENVPEMRVCAGTVLTLEQAQKAISAGAQAIISPGTNPEIVTWCLEMGLPVIPGCATPSEVETCLRLGLTTVKLFPAEVVGGVAMLKALSGPYSQVSFMPTGGINLQNASDYLRMKNVIAGGSWIADGDLLAAE